MSTRDELPPCPWADALAGQIMVDAFSRPNARKLISLYLQQVRLQGEGEGIAKAQRVISAAGGAAP